MMTHWRLAGSHHTQGSNLYGETRSKETVLRDRATVKIPNYSLKHDTLQESDIANASELRIMIDINSKMNEGSNHD